MTAPTDEQLAALRRRAALGWPTSHDLSDALEWLDAERAESARLLDMLNRANAGEAQQIIRAETAEASLADIKRAIENSELLGAVVDFGNLFEDVALEQWRWTLNSRLKTAQRWAEWFAAERDWLATINSEMDRAQCTTLAHLGDTQYADLLDLVQAQNWAAWFAAERDEWKQRCGRARGALIVLREPDGGRPRAALRDRGGLRRMDAPPSLRRSRAGAAMSDLYRIEYQIERRREGESEFTEIGFGSSGESRDIDSAAYALESYVVNGQWEATSEMPDPAEVLNEIRGS